MPDPETDTPQDAPETRPPEDAADGTEPPRKRRLFFILCAAVAVAAGGAGYAVAFLTGGEGPLTPASAEAGENQTTESEAAAPDELPAPKPAEDAEHYAYKDLEPLTVNLDEPRLARYVHATITLGVAQEDFEAASQRIDAETRVLRDWLTVYLTSLTLEDVRGAANLNRIRREILDAFNQELWPDGKPLIRKVLFKEFAVK
ncbi:MAG: flagellar basal body-associated FliL family protein [Phycisphaerae bacterium]